MMPGRGAGLSSWSSYNTMQRLSPDSLVLRVARALMEGSDDRDPRSEDVSMLTAANRVTDLQRRVEADVRRRIAEEAAPYESMSPEQLLKKAQKLEKKMLQHARDLEFEEAARLRDEIQRIRKASVGLPQRLAG